MAESWLWKQTDQERFRPNRRHVGLDVLKSVYSMPVQTLGFAGETIVQEAQSLSVSRRSSVGGYC